VMVDGGQQPHGAYNRHVAIVPPHIYLNRIPNPYIFGWLLAPSLYRFSGIGLGLHQSKKKDKHIQIEFWFLKNPLS